MPRPKVTFILPVLNAAGALFELALCSIREQDYPAERVELIVVDGGSVDATRSVAEAWGARIIENPNRLAEWGVKEGVLAADGDICVVFASDNELVGRDWLDRVAGRFERDPELAAVFGRLVSGDDDPPLNKYVELIQSEPLNWFLNRNLEEYLRERSPDEDGAIAFEVDPIRPLVWGANGLAVRTSWVRPIWMRPGYVADTDAFHALVVAGRNRVAYFPGAYCFHHQVASMRDMRRKWLRNSRQHLVDQEDRRDLSWVFVPSFRRRVLLFVPYSLLPAISLADALRRALRDRSPYWLYHPIACFVQAVTYAEALLRDPAGRRFLRRALLPPSG
jgi:glycosyltransferase involved in cell wall biosynthesis